MVAVHKIKKLWTEQPLLVGCGCMLLLSVVMCGVGGLLLGIGWQVAGGKISEISGVDSIIETSQSLAEQGLSFSVSNTTAAGIEYVLMPMQPREVTCEELKAALGPHLVGDGDTIVIRSLSTVPAVGGQQSITVPIRCTWDAPSAATPAPSAATPAPSEPEFSAPPP